MNKVIVGHGFLTLSELAYKYIISRFWPKTGRFWLPYQHHSSSANCARELFKCLNRSASLLVCTWKKYFGLGVANFLRVT